LPGSCRPRLGLLVLVHGAHRHRGVCLRRCFRVFQGPRTASQDRRTRKGEWMMTRFLKCVVTLVMTWLILLGLLAPPSLQAQTFAADKSEYVLMIAIDLSGSFKEKMATDGRAYEFVCAVVDRFFRSRGGKK